MSEKCNRACWNCWYDEFCDWIHAMALSIQNSYQSIHNETWKKRDKNPGEYPGL